mmetsp:Transcript_7594/g.16388  ORF Transcript_7594/g.16388 Transcript_7594/m.16388 type:complete len:388 (-) Transcript_7594:230-1393(-)|eukprot:CAMPEP_0171428482 /NCGR_PEP_ID=MMETSP0881-20121228/5273_1 /TAXON_ID=67004 /ORGANISM="Thalassiosira weissflogii, Strain CCMP1336" /LENGTH=387 /DNA_ID=CAMNT_0011948281 /DNA_START=7 /DNA_END=1170 /DNA_ORIENTATION=+
MAISPSEAHYIIESCLTDFRIDGRTQIEHRPYTITNRSQRFKTTPISNSSSAPPLILSNGSSRVHLPGSTTDILCSVKADLVHPSSQNPNEGVVELHVDLSLCGDGVSLGGASSGASKRRRQQREQESQVTSLLQRLVLPHAVNYKELVIWPGRYVWRLAIDVVVLRCDGCVLDGASIALREAIRETKLPRVQSLVSLDGDNSNDDKSSNPNGMSSLGGRENDLTVDGNIQNALPPSGCQNCPLVVTVSVLSAPPSTTGAITASFSKRNRSIPIVDARAEEEACASSRVCVSVDPSGMVCGVHTLGGGGVVLSDGGEEENGAGSSMPFAVLGDIVTTAAMASKNLYRLLDRGDGSACSLNKVQSSSNGSGEDASGYGYLLKDHFLIQ